jgi:hypothetical protein
LIKWLYMESIVLLFIGQESIKLTQQFLNLFIDILYVLSVAFVLALFVLLLVCLLVLSAKFVIDLALLFAFLLDEQLFDCWNCSWNCLFIFEDAVQFGVWGVFLLAFACILKICVSFYFLSGNAFKLYTEFLDLVLYLLEITNLVNKYPVSSFLSSFCSSDRMIWMCLLRSSMPMMISFLKSDSASYMSYTSMFKRVSLSSNILFFKRLASSFQFLFTERL